MIDLHSHILPGLDDGPGTIEESLEMCAIACADGIETIVATPHMLDGIYNVKREDILAGVEQLSQASGQANQKLTILPGADIYVDRDLPKLLKEGNVLTVADRGQHLMLELPEEAVPPELLGLLFELQLAGITPIITHPERNLEIQRDTNVLRNLVESGNLTQITAGSLTGLFGSSAEKCSIELLQSGLAHLLASDSHDSKYRRGEMSKAREVVRQLQGDDQAQQMTYSRAKLIVEGGYVAIPEPRAAVKKGFFSFLAKSKAATGG